MHKGFVFGFGFVLALWGAVHAPAAAPPSSLIVIANPDTPALSPEILQKVYLGKIVEVDGRAVIPVNLEKGSVVRKEFMEQVLAQDDDKFIAYWTVRRYIGKGSPPREFSSIEQQLDFIRSTPGAVGYVSATVEISAGLKTILKKP